MNWVGCRNDLITLIYPKPLYNEYLEYKKSKDFIPYLPNIKDKKELHYELNSIWWSCPDGILFKEDVKESMDSEVISRA
jgi:hypothetical protein